MPVDSVETVEVIDGGHMVVLHVVRGDESGVSMLFPARTIPILIARLQEAQALMVAPTGT